MSNVDRLARGYVRQELRPLKQASEKVMEYDFFREQRHLLDTYFARNKRLPETVPPQLVRIMEDNFYPKLWSLGKLPRDLEFEGLRARNVHQTNTLYWQANEHDLTDTSDHEFVDDTVDLRFNRLIVDRKRIIIDDHFLPVSVSEHALARMSERKFNVETPLAAFSSEMGSWLPMSMAFLFVALHLQRQFGMGIPVGDGFVLASIVAQSTAPIRPNFATNIVLSRRMQLDNRGLNFVEAPRRDLLKVPDDRSLVFRINTYISGKQLTWEQEWVRDRLKSIMERHMAVMPTISLAVIEGQAVKDNEFEAIQLMLADLVRLVEDDIWAHAIRTV